MDPEFSLERKGYNRFEVDRFIMQSDNEIELLKAKLAECQRLLAEKEAELEKLLRDRQYIGDTMIQAEIAAREIVEEAEARAQERESRKRADEEAQLKRLEEKTTELEQMRKRMEYLLRAQLALLEKDLSDS